MTDILKNLGANAGKPQQQGSLVRGFQKGGEVINLRQIFAQRQVFFGPVSDVFGGRTNGTGNEM